MLPEGVPAPTIEQASSQAGYPAPVLQLSDELNMELMAKIRKATKAAIEAEGGEWRDHPAFAVIDRMLEEGRAGKLRGAGFYDYEDGKRTGLWPACARSSRRSPTRRRSRSRTSRSACSSPRRWRRSSASTRA